MRSEPQAGDYRPDPRILPLAPWLADPVKAAEFPRHLLRFRNRRWSPAVGLDRLSDEQWIDHFGRFQPLSDNLPQPLALRYHGHQFRHYNPDIGDGRGFLFAQLRESSGRLLDLGTKGSGRTPYSRDGDGRLTLKGAVREIMATEMLEALGANTSKTFSVVETGEHLWRGDEPSPTRAAVLLRLSHGHIRIGTFQRLRALEQAENMAFLVDYCLDEFPGPPPPEDAPGRDEPAVILLHQVVERMADLAASYMVAGFVHGVLNSDNMNLSGESFDYGPWRWLPRWDPAFTAAYFDHSGLYAFGRQPEAIHWDVMQLAVALRPLAEAEPMIALLDTFGDRYQPAITDALLWRLGRKPIDPATDRALVQAIERALRASGAGIDRFFFDAFAQALPTEYGPEWDEARAALARYAPRATRAHPYWRGEPCSMLIDEVEMIWSHIAEADDWSAFDAKVASIRAMGDALVEQP